MATEICANCKSTIGALETPNIFKNNIVCTACNDLLRRPARESAKASDNSEKTLFTGSPAMFRNQPVMFMFILIVFPLGILIFPIWWLQCKCTGFTVTNKNISERKGILSKSTNEIRNADIRQIQVHQSMTQRIFRVGNVAVSSASTDGTEIIISGIKSPQKVADLIRSSRP